MQVIWYHICGLPTSGSDDAVHIAGETTYIISKNIVINY